MCNNLHNAPYNLRGSPLFLVRYFCERRVGHVVHPIARQTKVGPVAVCHVITLLLSIIIYYFYLPTHFHQ